MSDVKRLIIGIALVAVGLGMVLSANSFLAIVGGIMGLVGSYLTIKVLLTGQLR